MMITSQFPYFTYLGHYDSTGREDTVHWPGVVGITSVVVNLWCEVVAILLLASIYFIYTLTQMKSFSSG